MALKQDNKSEDAMDKWFDAYFVLCLKQDSQADDCSKHNRSEDLKLTFRQP